MKVFRTAYEGRNRVTSDPVGDSLTEQCFQSECDIGRIVNRHKQTGMWSHVNSVPGEFGDFSNVVDYQTAQNQLMQAEESFMSLPSQLRLRFANDAGVFMDFVTNPANQAEMVELGLAKPRDPVDLPVSSAPSST